MKLQRIWFIGLAAIVAIAAIACGQPRQWANRAPSSAIVQAQTPAPEVTPAPETAPIPEVTPTPTATPAPAETPPSPAAPPTPPTSIPEIAPPPPSALPLAENPYQDPSGRFQVGIIQEFNQSVVTGVPLFESSDGKLAYTVTVRPRLNNRPLEPWILIQVATDTFARGEGMLVQEFEPVNSELGGAIAPWMGTLTMGKNQQPMQGILLSRQVPGQLLILAIAATESAADRVDAVYSTLEPTLKGIEK